MFENKNKSQQNIYNSSKKEQDIYNPQIEKKLINQRELDLKRKNLTSKFLLGITITFIIFLIIVITNYYITPIEKNHQ